MAAMNPVGGPVPGMPMMNNGIPGGSRANSQEDQSKTILNTYIYDYFLKNELYDCARALVQSEHVSLSLGATKASPRLRRDADGNPLNNGVDENSMETEIKEEADSKRPDDLPMPKIPTDLPQNSLLQDWWCLFWDVWAAQRKKNKPGDSGAAVQYLQYTQQQQRLRQAENQQLLRQMNPAMMQNQYMIRLQNGMELPPHNQLPRKAMQNSRNATPQQVQLKNQQFMQHQMQRGNSSMGMNGEPRPQSPSSAENAPSPSKRPRLENGPFQGQPVGPAGRGQPQGMPGQPMVTGPQADIAAQSQHMLLQNGLQLPPQQFTNFQQQHPDMQQKNLQAFSDAVAQQRGAMNNGGLPKGIPNPGGVPNQGSPMMPQGSEGQAMNINIGAYYEGNSGPVRMNGSGQTGGNALQDYQLQLMLLEQQNKKRLLMARAEQDGGVVRPDQNAMHVQQGLQGMSPQGPRPGPSPNPQEQMNRRGSPKMNQVGMPGSPLPDGTMPKGRASPTAMGLHPGQVPHGMAPGLMQEMGEVKPTLVGGAPNGAMMRPPSSHPAGLNGQPLTAQQLEALTRANRMQQSQNWQQVQQVQQAQQQQVQQAQQVTQGPNPMMQQPHQAPPPQPIGTPQPRNAMPPPPTTNGNGRTQPSSPQQNPAPPTPQQTNKPNPKTKKKSEGGPKRPMKKATGNVNAGVTPSSEAEPPPTPTPPTPITPMHHTQSFSAQQGKQNPGQMAGNSQAPTSAPIPAPHLIQPPSEATQVPTFPGTENQDMMSLDFASLETGDVFSSIDFEAFLRTDDAGDSSGLNFDMGTSTGYGAPDGLEAGTGDV